MAAMRWLTHLVSRDGSFTPRVEPASAPGLRIWRHVVLEARLHFADCMSASGIVNGNCETAEPASTNARLLRTLWRELNWLRSGGYRRRSAAFWRPRWILLDSPVCQRGSDGRSRASCAGCPLRDLLGSAPSLHEHACYGLKITDDATLADLQRGGYLPDIEAKFEAWLMRQIAGLVENAPAAVAASSHAHVAIASPAFALPPCRCATDAGAIESVGDHGAA